METAAPEVLGTLLNEYVGGMTDVVFAHEGTVAKIIGDHGGTIECETRPRQTVFRAMMPMYKNAERHIKEA